MTTPGSDTLKKVKSGDPLVIPATTFNAFVDAAQDFQGRQRSVTRSPTQTFRQAGIVPVLNDTGSNLPRFAVVGIDAPIIDPADNEPEFENRVALRGVAPAVPDHLAGRIVITLEPIAADAIGRAVVSGVVACTVHATAEHAPFATLIHGDASKLVTGGGCARILWIEPGTGDKRAIVLLGQDAGACLAEITATANDTLTVELLDAAGSKLGRSITVAKPSKLRHDADEYPLVTTLTTVDTNQIDVSDGSTDETWHVTPTYSVGDRVTIEHIAATGLTSGGHPVTWIDLNIDGRRWEVECA